MEKEKHNIRIDKEGARHATVPLWQELPQITVRLEEGHYKPVLLRATPWRASFLYHRPPRISHPPIPKRNTPVRIKDLPQNLRPGLDTTASAVI